MKYIRYIVLLVVIFGLNCQVSAKVKINATLDSATLLMGNQTIIHIEIVQDVAQKGQIINEPQVTNSLTNLVEGIEFVGVTRIDSSDIGSNRLQINKDYVIQSFDSGLYTIPPFKYVIGIDTFKSQPLTLKVFPVYVDSLYSSISDFAPIETIESRWYDFIPDWITDNLWVIVLLIVLIIGVVAIIFIVKTKMGSIKQTKKVIPPYDLAMIKLTSLKDAKLCEMGQEKEFYTQLTNILREYLAGRFNIYAMEMTTTQIIQALKYNEEIRMTKKNIEQVLQMADFVKFAKVRPLPDDNVKSYQSALQFVEDTKPAIVEVDETNKFSV